MTVWLPRSFERGNAFPCSSKPCTEGIGSPCCKVRRARFRSCAEMERIPRKRANEVRTRWKDCMQTETVRVSQRLQQMLLRCDRSRRNVPTGLRGGTSIDWNERFPNGPKGFILNENPKAENDQTHVFPGSASPGKRLPVNAFAALPGT